MHRFLFLSHSTLAMQCLAEDMAAARAYFFDVLGLDGMPAFRFRIIRLAGRV